MLVTALGLAATVLAVAVHTGRGEYPIGVLDVLGVLLGGGSETQRFVVLGLRLPRSLTGALVGAALAMSGAITQTITRNPLASPDILGITTGAGAAAVAAIVFGGSSGAVLGLPLGNEGLPVVALVGGLFTGLLLYLLAYRNGLASFRLVLTGIGVNAIGVSLTSWLLMVAGVTDAGRATVWLNGSLGASSWEDVVPVGLALLLLTPAALVLAFVLGALQLDDDTSHGLGVRVGGARATLLLLAVALASVATAAAGPIAFVALVSPQLAVRLVRAARPPLLASATLGAALTVTADVMARNAFGAVQLPVGIVTAVLGAPFLMYLLARQHRKVRI